MSGMRTGTRCLAAVHEVSRFCLVFISRNLRQVSVSISRFPVFSVSKSSKNQLVLFFCNEFVSVAEIVEELLCAFEERMRKYVDFETG